MPPLIPATWRPCTCSPPRSSASSGCEPLLDGQIRSAFSMTEPAVASPATPATSRPPIARDGGDYVINGRKWWTSGAADPRCKILIVMGRTNPDAASHQQQSMVLVPVDTPGVTVLRSTPVFGWQDQHGHCELIYDNVRVPATNLLGEEGAGFAIAQARLGPGPHPSLHARPGRGRTRAGTDGDRARNRVAFGRPLAEQGVVRSQSRSPATRSTRPGCCARRRPGPSISTATRPLICWSAQIKAVAPQVACDVIDRAIQVHGAAGVSDDIPLARLYSWHRAMRIFDGPDEVHLRTIARAEIGREKSAFAAAVT